MEGGGAGMSVQHRSGSTEKIVFVCECVLKSDFKYQLMFSDLFTNISQSAMFIFEKQNT